MFGYSETARQRKNLQARAAGAQETCAADVCFGHGQCKNRRSIGTAYRYFTRRRRFPPLASKFLIAFSRASGPSPISTILSLSIL